MRIDRANLLDGIAGNAGQEQIAFGTVSTVETRKSKQAEALSESDPVAEVIYQNPAQQEKKEGTMEDVRQQAQNLDVTQKKNEMVVASNSATPQDCKKMEEDGFSLPDTEIETVVTETDKIKMQLAKAGVDISYFGDSLSAEQLEEVFGSAAVVQQFLHSMAENDLPLTAENAADIKKAAQQLGELGALSDGAVKYLLDNALQPTISNVYKAQYSGSAVYTAKVSGEMVFSDAMDTQMRRIIAEAGLLADEQTLSDCQWLVQNGVPLTADNLNDMQQLKALAFPVDEAKAAAAMADALAAGKRPQDAMLVEGYSMREQAQRAVDTVLQATDEDLAYVVSEGEPVTLENLRRAHNLREAGAFTKEQERAVQELTATAAEQAENAAGDENAAEPMEGNAVGDENAAAPAEGNAVGNENAAPVKNAENDERTDAQSEKREKQNQSARYTDKQLVMITARRQLEEVRLIMTVDAGFFMLKMGVSIQTESMESLITELRQIEEHYYKDLLIQGGAEASGANVAAFADTTEKIEQLKMMPAYALGVKTADVSTLSGLYEAGSEMQQDFEQAKERYETMQTQVRKDLGDSIQKAFRNADDILKDLEMDVTAENERAVRILGYNHTEITRESVIQMKAADQQVQLAFGNLTPAVVREMIRRGVNPLDMDIRQLNETAREIKEDLHMDAPEDKYSAYLYKLEQNRDITEEERSAYVGIYRLMHQVAESDGAAVGALVNQGAELTMRNLLTAVRSERHGKVDISVDDGFGEREGGGYQDSITEQIEAAYQSRCIDQALREMTPERLRGVMEQPDWENMTPEQFLERLQESPDDVQAEEAYYRQQLEQLSQAGQASEAVYEALERFDLPDTVTNVLAMAEFIQNRNGAYRRFFARDNGRTPDSEKTVDRYREPEDGEIDFEAVKQDLLERFSENLKKPQELGKAMAELAECAEHCMRTMIIEQDVSSLDIRQLKLMNAQIAMGTKMASEECFSLPIVVDGQVTNVTLRVVRDKNEKGLVNISLETARFGRIGAEFTAKKDGISGYVVSDSNASKDALQRQSEAIAEALRGEEDLETDIHFVTSHDLDLNRFSQGGGKSEEPESEAVREVQTRRLYGMAEGFIRVLQQMDAA